MDANHSSHWRPLLRQSDPVQLCVSQSERIIYPDAQGQSKQDKQDRLQG